MFFNSVTRRFALVCTISVASGALATGDDEPKEVVPAPTVSVTPEQEALLEAEPAIKKATTEFDNEIRIAEEALRFAKVKAASKRLEFFQQQLKSYTQAGDFDRAIACKSMIERLELSGVEGSRPRPKNVVKFGGHTYALIQEPVTWHIAKRRCEMMGGHLAYVKSKQEKAFIAKLAGKHNVWLGASDEENEGDWRWLDGTKWTPGPGEVDNFEGTEHHLDWDSQRKRLNDVCSDSRFFFVCEWEAPQLKAGESKTDGKSP